MPRPRVHRQGHSLHRVLTNDDLCPAYLVCDEHLAAVDEQDSVAGTAHGECHFCEHDETAP